MNGKTKISAVFAVIVFVGILLFAWKLPQKTPSAIHTENTMTVLQKESGDRLSAGSLVCAAGLVGAVVCKNTNNVLLAILAAILVGALVGLCNGVLCAVGCLPGFIATLASMTILRR